MIRWAAPHYLYLLLAVPVLAALLALGARLKRRQYRRLADPDLVPRLTGSYSGSLALLKSALLLAALLFLVVALARPRWGERLQVYKGRGIDIVIALDASKSMLATDLKPNRLERAKGAVAQLLDGLSANQVGITEFAGDCYVLCPLTPDVEAAKLFLDVIEPGNVPRPGTNIQRAIEVSSSLFDPKQESDKALVLITDGDNLEGDPMAAAQAAASQGVRIFAVGAGTLAGSTVPDGAGGTSYKKDRDDKIVISRLAERMLLVMAKATDGRYFRSETLDLGELASAIDRLKKREIGGGGFVEYEERYQIFLAIACILAFCGVLVSDRRGRWFDGVHLRRSAQRLWRRLPLPLLIALITLGGGPRASAGVGADMRAGNALADKGQYDAALQKYQEALVREPDNVRIHYNIARALYKAGRYPEAISEYQLCLLTKDAKLQARTMYNIGNCQFRQQRLDDAIASYTASLLLDPKDMQAKQNLEFCYKKVEEQKNEQETNPKPPSQPSDYAKRMKALADEAVARREYQKALDIMNDLVSKDKSGLLYQDYIGRLKDVVEIYPQ